MARPLRIQRSNLTYHVTSRGNARGRIFVDHVDRIRFLEILEETVTSFALLVHSYCEMDNHYHLVVTTPRGNISRAMQHQNGVYAQWWNRRHRRCGHIFQGPFHAPVVERDEYLLEVCRYVALNPVRANMVRRPEQWPWSSYRATVGLASAPAFLNDEELLARFGSRTEMDKARSAYRGFVEAGLLPTARESGTRWQQRAVIGTKRFAEALLNADHSAEIPRRERRQARPTLNTLFRGAVRQSARQHAMAAAYRTHEYSMKQIADYLGLHYTTVSRAIRECRSAVPDRAKTDK